MPKSTLSVAKVSDEMIFEKIYIIRGQKVMLDKDLAEMYGVPTFRLNEAVKRNKGRFPDDFMFQLTKQEFDDLRSQIETLENTDSLRLQNETLKKGRGQHPKYLPYAFTEQGVSMLSGILNSDKAINMNIAIMRAFVAIRKILIQGNDLKLQLQAIKDYISEHDAHLNQIYDAMENLLDEKAAQKTWEERKRIGFKIAK